MLLFYLENDRTLSYLLEQCLLDTYVNLEVFPDTALPFLVDKLKNTQEEFILIAHIGLSLTCFQKILQEASNNSQFQSLVLLSSVDHALMYTFKELAINQGIKDVHIIKKSLGINNIVYAIKNIILSAEYKGDISVNAVLKAQPINLTEPIEFSREELLISLKNGAIKPYLQPQISASTNQLDGFEVLARLNYKGEIYAPSSFLHLFSRYHLMTQLTLCLLTRTLRFFRGMKRADSISINVDTQSIHEVDFYKKLLNVLKQLSTRSTQVTVEITETVANINSVVLANLLGLRLAGIKISMDDFGTGYSSMDGLIRLPISEIKIDREHVAILTHNNKAFTIVANMCGLAKSMGLKVVAEGVENDTQLFTVKALGVDSIQGNLIASATPLSLLSTLKTVGYLKTA